MLKASWGTEKQKRETGQKEYKRKREKQIYKHGKHYSTCTHPFEIER